VRADASRWRALLATATGVLTAGLGLPQSGLAADIRATSVGGGTVAEQPSGASEQSDQSSGGSGQSDQSSGGSGQSPLGKVRLLRTAVAPGSLFLFGDPVTFEFEVDGFSGTVDLTVEVVSQRTREVVKRIPADDVEANVPASVQWAGRTDQKGRAKPGTYRFQVHAREAGKVDGDSAEGGRTVGYHTYKFPVRGPHQYGDGIGAGRGHRGQDVFADCGTPLEAAWAGRVEFKGFQEGGAGHYLVIDGRRTGKDFVYMHLREGATVEQGETVRTGQRIGEVGESGNASGCHLHFELWSAPGWYEGGRFLDPTPALKRWDRYS
jgi:hypothetical protein